MPNQAITAAEARVLAIKANAEQIETDMHNIYKAISMAAQYGKRLLRLQKKDYICVESVYMRLESLGYKIRGVNTNPKSNTFAAFDFFYVDWR